MVNCLTNLQNDFDMSDFRIILHIFPNETISSSLRKGEVKQLKDNRMSRNITKGRLTLNCQIEIITALTRPDVQRSALSIQCDIFVT